MDSLENEIKNEINNMEVLAGLAGSITGYLIAERMNYGTFGSILSIGLGHSAGHFIAHKYF
jgi:uncharacterized protein YneF (UPF0154 family)